MTVSSVSATSAATNSTTSATKPTGDASSLDYHAFLQLLIAQLKTQDPTKPMDSGQFMSQLATFSQVEQSVATNSKLDSLLTSSALAQADSVIGRTVTSSDGETSGKVVSVKITSDGPLATLQGGGQVLLGAGVVIR
jgi:flagellar basal-body rod modification protein FlgD